MRDIAVFENRILVLAGPVGDGPGRYAILSWDGASEDVDLLAELPFDASRKPEGLLPLGRQASELRVLVFFDGDREGAPTPFTVR